MRSQQRLQKNSGQIIIEYILLMALVVSLAAALTKGLVGRADSGSGQGVIIKTWNSIIKAIGNDLPDCPNQTDYSKPNCGN